MFRQYLVQRYLQNPDQNLNSCCDISKICFVRPQRVILLLIIGCPAARNDHKIASVEQKNLSLWCLSTNILPRKYCSAGYFWRQLLRNFICLEGGGREGGRGGILSKKTNFGGDGRGYNAFTTFTHFSIKIFFAEFCG